MRMATTDYVSKYMVPCWWNCLRRTGRYGLAGGDLPLGVSFEFSKVKYHAIPLCFLLMDRVSLGPAWAI